MHKRFLFIKFIMVKWFSSHSSCRNFDRSVTLNFYVKAIIREVRRITYLWRLKIYKRNRRNMIFIQSCVCMRSYRIKKTFLFDLKLFFCHGSVTPTVFDTHSVAEYHLAVCTYYVNILFDTLISGMRDRGRT